MWSGTKSVRTESIGTVVSSLGHYAWEMMPFERFRAWRKCHELALAVYHVTRQFPTDERYGLSSQTRRAAYSAAATIAEGSAKRGTAEFCRYLNISLGSLSELAYAMKLVKDLELLGNTDWQRIEKLRLKASKSTWGLYRSIQHRKKADG